MLQHSLLLERRNLWVWLWNIAVWVRPAIALHARLDTRLSMSTPQVSTDAHRAMGGKRHMYMLWELELLFPVVLVLVCSLDMT